MSALTLFDQDLRRLLTRMIAERGHAPSAAELADAAGTDEEAVLAALRRLHDAHALLLHPHRSEPWAVHPFALAPGGCWVETQQMGYWANCLYCGLGIAAALGRDATLTARIGGEGEPAVYRVRGGMLIDTDGVFHLSTPVARWWDNVIFACSTFQPFREESEIDPWCARHRLPRGAVMTLDALWRFASDWYGTYLQEPWRKRSIEEVRALFARHRLTGPFWEVG
ncbi:MAG: hypothetical protein QOC65_782 [Sphingomonadales bacterium]|nr:hypothetical protein [Sphingomonadales bacterium]